MQGVEDMKAIETVYKGYRFRSRLEARWAVFFDALEMRYTYEPEGFHIGKGVMYLPDFYLPDLDTWIEIKPQLPDVFMDGYYTLNDDLNKFILFSEEKYGHHYMICGTPGLPEIATKNHQWVLMDGYVALGLARLKDCPLVTLNSFAYTQGGKNLDIWPVYLNMTKIENGKYFCESPHLPNGVMQRFYFGKGIKYNHKKLVAAYIRARQARFEHGRRGN